MYSCDILFIPGCAEAELITQQSSQGGGGTAQFGPLRLLLSPCWAGSALRFTFLLSPEQSINRILG